METHGSGESPHGMLCYFPDNHAIQSADGGGWVAFCPVPYSFVLQQSLVLIVKRFFFRCQAFYGRQETEDRRLFGDRQ